MPDFKTLKKKTLIVSSWAPPMVGGPQNLYNLFSQIQPEQFGLLTSRVNVEHSLRSGVAGSWLPCTYHYIEGGTITPAESPVASSTSPTWFDRVVRLVAKIPFIGRRLVSLGNIFRTLGRYAMAGRRIIRRGGYEMLFGISDTGFAMIGTYLISRLTKKPYTLYLFDLYLGNLLSPPYDTLAKWFERQIMTNASLVILTNEVTEQYYKKRYGQAIKTAVVHNSIFDRHTINTYDAKPPYTIVFTGNVYWAQEQAVMNLLAAMEKLTDLPVTLKLFVPNPPESLKASIAGKKNVELGAAGQDEMPAIQGAATLLFLPLAWDTKAPDIIATATPGKFTDYLASSRPMLVHAPDYAYVSTYTKEHNLGLVVDKNSVDALAKAIRDFLANHQQGKMYVDNALKVFATNHEATKNAAKLTELLNLID